MIKGILGYKRGMTRIYDAQGRVAVVTVIEAGPCTVTQVKTPARDGYSAVQLGFGETRPERLTRAERGHLKKSRAGDLRHLKEFRGGDVEGVKVGQTVDVGLFAPGERVHISGRSRGLGTAGTIKRHHFNRQRKTHGQTDRERAPGSVGAGTTPGRTLRGQRMAGRMGGGQITVRGLEVVLADPARNLLAVRGAVPGHPGGLVVIRAALQK